MGLLIGDCEWRGKGVANEVINKTSSWIKRKLKIKVILLGVSQQNKSAIKAYQKAGFYFPRKGSSYYKRNRMVKYL